MSEIICQVYKGLEDAQSAERRELYNQVYEFCKRFVGRSSKDFDSRLKTLHFTGELALQKEGGEGMTPAFAPLVLCLCAPRVNEEEFKGYFDRFGSRHTIETITDLMDFPIKVGKLQEYPLLLDRWNMIAYVQRIYLAAEDQVQRRLKGVFWLLAYEGKSAESLTPVLFADIEKNFNAALLERYAEQFDDGASKFLFTLFRGAAEELSAYEDPWFIEFCRRFFGCDFAPELQAYFGSVYESVGEAERITFDGKRILLSAA
ncbi:hypothetical protein QYS36_15035 [Pseudomonas sp. G34]|uniref:hypothetical protein n=1 Tax=Pseudomonas sp. G34 TaxID=3059083 RepID=UPI002809FE58|nr:hypothetical protein [Pseudomonas sp. G34]MDQ7986253.1 hypothetical protein [Pseudomonas sp. G34]